MDLLDRLLGHDLWTTQQFLEHCRGLADEQLDRPFDIGRHTVRETLGHMIYNLEAWTDCMNGGPVREEPGDSLSDLATRLERSANDFCRLARGVADRDGWDEPWVDPLDGAKRSYGGAIAHVITHSMHHRAQLRYMLTKLGLKDLPEGDVLSWENREKDSSS